MIGAKEIIVILIGILFPIWILWKYYTKNNK